MRVVELLRIKKELICVLKNLGVVDINNDGLALVIVSLSTLGPNRTLRLIGEIINQLTGSSIKIIAQSLTKEELI